MKITQKIFLSLVILALFNFLFVIIFGDNGFVDLNLLKRQRDDLIEKNAQVAQDNLYLYREIERLKHDPELIENVARQELGMIGKDEVILKPQGRHQIVK